MRSEQVHRDALDAAIVAPLARRWSVRVNEAYEIAPDGRDNDCIGSAPSGIGTDDRNSAL